MKKIDLNENLSPASLKFVNDNFSSSNWQASGLFLMSLKLNSFLLIEETGKSYLFDEYPFTTTSSVAANLNLSIQKFDSIQDALDFLMI